MQNHWKNNISELISRIQNPWNIYLKCIKTILKETKSLKQIKCLRIILADTKSVKKQNGYKIF